VICKCDLCGGQFDILEKSYRVNKRNHDGMYVCRSCSCQCRSSNPEYITKIGSRGKEHWSYGRKGKDSPSFGKKWSAERRKKTLESKQRLLPSGLTVAETAARKGVKTQRSRGSYQVGVAKAAITKEKNNSWVSYRTKQYRGFYYRSSLEKRFLTDREQTLARFSNCSFSICYQWRGKTHYYVPDFFEQETNTIYEIKSCWTWDNKGKNQQLKALNKCKLAASREAGYNVVLLIYRQQSSGKYSKPEIYDHTQIGGL